MNSFTIIRRFYIPVFLIYVLLSVGIIGIGLLLFPDAEKRTPLFWGSIAIMEIVLTMPVVMLRYILLPPQSGYEQRAAGIMPILFIAVNWYILAMFALLAFNAFIYDMGRFVLIPHILMVIVFSLFALLLQVSMAAQHLGTERFENTANTPSVLVACLKQAEDKLAVINADKNVVSALKMLREEISYRLPVVGNITKSECYRQFAEEVRQLSKTAMQTDNTESLMQIKTDADTLRSGIGIIQAELRR